ncbi:MAG: 3-methyl-2-oxobutanoate hydroxymethyltransferase [Pseudomonadota bacterium]
MESESARASSAAEARYRINAPNSKGRAIKVIALDHPSERVVKSLAARQWNGATFFTASAFGDVPRKGESFAGWLSDLAGRTKNLVEEVTGADLVVMVAQAGENAAAASIIGEACSLKRVNTTALVLGNPGISDEALSKTLSQLRPWSLMLVISGAEEYVADMLSALRA